MNTKIKMIFKYLFIFILIIISAVLYKISNSRFNSEANTSGTLKIAKPIVEIEQISNNSISNMKPGETVEYKFNIVNTDGKSENEVAMNYYIQVIYNDNNLPLTYEIYDITNGSENKLQTENDKTSFIPIGHESIETHKYKIKFSWPSTEISSNYANANMSFTINVYAEQNI